MMIKVKILNMKNFLKAVNHCKGRVFLKNHKCLPLTLAFDNPRDYLDIVSYYAGDC